MSILIHIPRNLAERGPSEDMEDNYNRVAINLPRHQEVKSNDLSKLEVSVTSSKYTLSGDDMVSNLSFDSNHLNGGNSFRQVVQNNELENEIEMENQNVNHLTPRKKCQRNYYHNNNETNNNFSSERVICEELSRAHENFCGEKDKNDLSNMSNLINEKNVQINYQQISPIKEEQNFIYKFMKNNDKDFNRKPKVLNKGFIMDEKIKACQENEDRISKINEKVTSMIKTQDTLSKNSDSGYSSNSTSVKLTCFQKVCSSKKI